MAGRQCIASNVGQQEAAGRGAQGVCEGKRPGAGPRGPARAGQPAGPRRAADCSAARSLRLSQRRGAESDLPGTARERALCLVRRDSEAQGALRTARGWPRRPAWDLLLGVWGRKEDAQGRRVQAERLRG